MTPPMDEARTGADSGGSGVDLRDLVARLEQCEQHSSECAEFRARVVETLDAQLQYLARELRALLV
jgi:hypothetical protein